MGEAKRRSLPTVMVRLTRAEAEAFLKDFPAAGCRLPAIAVEGAHRGSYEAQARDS